MIPNKTDEFSRWSLWLILSLFLIIGTVGFTYDGFARLRFWLHFGNRPTVESVDLPSTKIHPDGFISVNGTIGKIVSTVSGPYNLQDLSTTENYYFPLIGKEKIIYYVVKHPGGRSGKLWLYARPVPQMPTPGTTSTVTGIADWYEGGVPQSVVNNLTNQGYQLAPDVKLLVMGATPPTVGLLSWYLLSLAATMSGLILLICSIKKLKPHVL